MKLQRFIGKFDLTGDRLVSKDKPLISQLQKVFRFEAGNKVLLCDGSGNEATGTIEILHPEQVIFTLENKISNPLPAGRESHIFQAILKKENFETFVQKATECGVTSITPLITERTVKLAINNDRLLAITKEASEQSGRTVLPIIHKTITIEELLKQNIRNTDTEISIILDPSSSERIESAVRKYKVVNCLIGPEGGFSPRELELAGNAGIESASLGKLVLRGETAGMIATYIISNEN